MPFEQKIKAWSFSRHGDYELCPAKAKYKHVLRLPEPGNAAMDRGNMIHKQAELYIKGQQDVLVPELVKFSVLFKQLRAKYKKKLSNMAVEDTWAFTKDWVQTVYNDWANCWLRIKVDCAEHENPTTIIVSDWKSGKFRPEQHESYLKQLELYALGALRIYAHAKIVKPRLVYTDIGEIYPKKSEPLIFTRKQLPMLTKTWEDRVEPMLNDTVFAPRPSDQCRWCHYRKNNGGPCQF